MEIRLDSVLEKVVDSHYENGIDWRTRDTLGEYAVPRVYRSVSFIKYEQFKRTLLSGGFISSRDTVASKWLALTGDGTFSIQTGRKERTAFINLEQVKIAVPKFSKIPFSVSEWEKLSEDARARSACGSGARVNGAYQEKVVE